MRIRVMSKKGKKIVSIMLAFMMVIPLALGQVYVTKAATPQTTKDVFGLELNKDSSKTFARGETVILTLKSKAAISASMIHGTLSFKDKDGNAIQNAFSLVKVNAENWSVGYNTESLQFALNSNNLMSIAASKEIATIELQVVKEIDAATAVISFDSRYLDVRVDSDGSQVTATTPDDDVTCALTSSISGSRGVELSLPATMKQPIYTFSSTGANLLKRFTVPVSITKNTGFNAMTVQFQYDSSKMSYKGYELTPKALMYLNCITEYQGVTVGSSGTPAGYVSLSFVGVDDTKMTGDFLTLTFEVSNSAKAADTADITPNITELENLSETANLSATANKCTVTFEKGYERGDVNMDHKVNLIDVTYALQGYNGVRNLTDEQKALADVNGDGTLSLVDVLMLLKKCNGENIAFA